MEDTSKSIIKQAKDLSTEKIVDATLAGSVKAAVSLIPFFGELINSTIPDIYRICKATYFHDFLMGINERLKQKNFSEADCREFESKLEDTSSYEYLSTIIDSVFFSKSSRARTILGIIVADYIDSCTIPYEDLVIISALKELIDEEINTFIKIYEVAIGGGKEETNGEGAFYISYYPQNVLVNTTFSKLIQLNVIGNKAESLYSKSPNSLHGNVTSITEKLLYYIGLTNE